MGTQVKLCLLTTTLLLLFLVLYSQFHHDIKNMERYSREPSVIPTGEVIMSKMGNETLKAELGRSTWRLLHTMAAKFPYEPKPDEKQAFIDYIHLFSRLYPCGDCAKHFQGLLKETPPIVDNRDALTQWMCTIHNKVNARLGKPIFDCSKVGEMWKCGCAEEQEKKT